MKYVALLRGINVGGNNALPMAGLADVLKSLKCDNVKTYIQSGNAVFSRTAGTASTLCEKIKKKIAQEFSISPDIFLLEEAEFLKASKASPFKSKTGKDLHFYFLEDAPQKPNMEKIESLKASDEKYMLKSKVFYLYAPSGVGRSKLAAHVEKCLGVAATARNFNTVQKLQEMLNEIDA